ncbi:MAG: aminotransferase class V-fold PLP-dependent enzyme [Planctomycetota bacterium]|nr:aminotransferase class V-fold PLP-dependent enzyme [Planctomycetota bacterium]
MPMHAPPPVDWPSIRADFMLAPGEIYLNNGTWSALPRPVFEAQVEWMKSAEANPTRVGAARGGEALWRVHGLLAAYLSCAPADLVFHVNVTQALNQALFSYPWKSGGEFLIGSREYGALVNASKEAARRHGLRVRMLEVPAQPACEDELVAGILAQVGGEARGALLSHVTTGEGLVLPVARLAKEFRARGTILVVDGAHAPGLVPVELGNADIDFYGGNLHKWFLGPKGAGFLYVKQERQGVLEPRAVGWGGTPRDAVPDAQRFGGARFPHVFRIQGLHDFSAFLALEAALRYRASLGEERIRARVAELVAHARGRLCGELGLKDHSPKGALHAGLLSVQLPEAWRGRDAGARLYERNKITVACWPMPQGGPLVRVSPGICNSEDDLDTLARAIQAGP